jgi:hypothetical protein
MRSAAAAERARVARELVRLRDRETRLADDLKRTQAGRNALEDELALLERLAGDSSDGQTIDQGRQPRLRVVSEKAVSGSEEIELRGAQVRETAVRLLAGTSEPDQAVHYRTWFELLRRRGFVPAGKDPLATFLTQISRSPVVRRSTAPGVYSLDLMFPERARGQLERLQAELRESDELPENSTVEEIADVRERRARLNAEIDSVERSLTEALSSLGE